MILKMTVDFSETKRIIDHIIDCVQCHIVSPFTALQTADYAVLQMKYRTS